MKMSEMSRALELFENQTGESGKELTNQEIQKLLCENGVSEGNLYQELEMDSTLVDVHDDISTSRDEVQLHSHTFYEMIYCYSGNVQYLVGMQRYRLQRGDIVVVPPGISHRPLFLDQLTEPYHRSVFWISSEFREHLIQHFPELKRGTEHYLFRTGGTQWENLSAFFQTAVQENERREPGWQAVVIAQAELLCVGIARASVKIRPPQSEQRELLDEIILYIENNMTDKLSLGQTAQHFHVSESTVSQLFRKRMDVSFYRFVTQRRLIAAKNLIQTGTSLEQTAAEVGFGDYSNFYRTFRREYGITPAAYRQLVRKQKMIG